MIGYNYQGFTSLPYKAPMPLYNKKYAQNLRSTVHGQHTLMRHGPFLVRLVFSNKKALVFVMQRLKTCRSKILS